MEGVTYKCSLCGAPIDATTVDKKARQGYCPYCHLTVIFPRKTINGTSEIHTNVDAAIKEFTSGHFMSAEKIAQVVIGLSDDNLPALFILRYIEAFVTKSRRRSVMDEFFIAMRNIDPDEEEVTALIPLFKCTRKYLMDYEAAVLNLVRTHTSGDEAAKFMDDFSPYILAERPNSDFLKSDLIQAYTEITKGGSAPKTWYALWKSLTDNPDSPIKDNSYYLRTKTKLFYDNYLLPIGKILACIKDETYRGKFAAVYNKTKATIESHM